MGQRHRELSTKVRGLALTPSNRNRRYQPREFREEEKMTAEKEKTVRNPDFKSTIADQEPRSF